jgi:sulfate transport system permease protein
MTDPTWARRAAIAVALGFLLLTLGLPVLLVLVEALRGGLGPLVRALASDDVLAAARLSAMVVVIAVPLNTVFGLALAWAVTRFAFPGKTLLLTLVDLPFAVSPVIAGMLFVLLFGGRGLLGPWLFDHGLRILFSPAGVVLVTLFVTLPYVARELVPLMAAQGADEELAALTLGASGFTTFVRITLPKAKWGIVHGVLLATARALGEFGAVSVVSGHIRGSTNTLPLAVEVLYDEYRFSDAFAVASVLLASSVLTLVLKRLVTRKSAHDGDAGASVPALSAGSDELLPRARANRSTPSEVTP